MPRPSTWEFQSAPPHGRRRVRRRRGLISRRFQSAPPHGRRRSPSAAGRQVPTVSIRASAREATGSIASSSLSIAGFNPRLRTGGDMSSDGRPPAGRVFQSAPPHGRRLQPSGPGTRRTLFQSAPPHGRRLPGNGLRAHHVFVSIRASAREATAWTSARPAPRHRFNPRLRTGGDDGITDWSDTLDRVSIRASAREATPCPGENHGRGSVSIRASAREATAHVWCNSGSR